jgi:hypothetical protein
MSAQPSAIPSISATIRGKAALDEVRDLLDRLAKVDADLEACDEYPRLPQDACSKPAPMAWPTFSGIEITHDELHAVIQRRRDAILNKLQNKGIRIAPDPDHTHALPPERAPADDSP